MRTLLLSALLLAGCAATDDIGTNGADVTFDEFVQSVYQDEFGAYIVNGDETVAGLDELYQFYLDYYRSGQPSTVNVYNGADDIWNETRRWNITFCVNREFKKRYAQVVAAMETATADWETYGAFDFIYRSDQDGSCTNKNNNVVFDVRQAKGCQYLARAFFPHQPRAYRELVVCPSVWSYVDKGTISLPGLLRHELGHALGLRHEHTRPEAGECYEDDDWRAVTEYDPASVMHYPSCGGTSTLQFLLSDLDKEGIGLLYGTPQ